MAIQKRKYNPEDDLGFGSQPVIKSQPLINQNGTINVRRAGLPFFRPYDNYHKLITMSWTKFWLLIMFCYVLINVLFAFIYLFIGVQHLNGAEGHNTYEHFWDAFFFSHKRYLR
jgi:inward rectifier potassium channel